MAEQIIAPGDYRVGPHVVQIETGQICTYPTGYDIETIAYADEYNERLTDEDVVTTELAAIRNGRTSKLRDNPFLYDERPETYFDGTEEAVEWVYDPDNPLKMFEGMKVSYQGKLYIVVQYHVAEAPNFAPGPDTQALFRLFRNYGDPWVQPIGASDAYRRSEVVTYNGGRYRNDVEGNAFAPDVSGWTVLTPTPPVIEPWVQPTGAQDAYNIGNEVTHDNPNDGGNIWVYRSKIDANTTEPGRDGTFDRFWEPVVAV